MRLTVRPAARRDLRRHWGYLAEFNPAAADRFLDAAHATFAAIAKQPEMLGHADEWRRHAGVRSYRIFDPYNKYLAFFRVHKDYVEIKRVLHGTRNLPRFFRR